MPVQQPSAKLSGGRNRGPTRSNVSNAGIVLDPTRLGQVSLNRDAIQALTLAQAKVQITIGAGGTTASLISEETGKPIGGVDDLAKLMSLRSFVTKEKKQTASSSAREQVVTAAFRLSQKEKLDHPDYLQKHLDNSFVVAARPYESMCENVLSHEKVIKENFNTTEEWKNSLLKFCKLTHGVLVDIIAAMTRGEKEKGLLESLSIERGLPAYIRNKLVTKSLVMPKDMDLSRVLFPADPSKGLALTVKEWRTESMIATIKDLLVNSGFVITVLRSDELVLELVGMTAEQFSNKEDPKVQRVEKTRILVVPPFADHARVLSLLEKQNFRGFGLPATAMDQSKDRLANLCAVPLRAYAFSVRMAETLADFYDRIFPPGTIKAPDEKLGNYAKQSLAAIKSGTSCSLIDIINGDIHGPALMEWIRRECKILPNGDLDKKITKLFVPDEKGLEFDEILDTVVAPAVPELRADVVSKPVNNRELADVQAFEKANFSFGKVEKKRAQQFASTVLQRETKIFLRFVKNEHSRALSESMEQYFRGFYSEAIQVAAVRIAEARFDEFDVDEDIGSSADESADSDED
jgi:hypothetical protein